MILVVVLSTIFCFSFGKQISRYFRDKAADKTIHRYDVSKEVLSKFADEASKLLNLPTMIDEELELTRISAENGELIYHYNVIGYRAEDIDEKKFLPQLKNDTKSNTCKNDDMAYLLKTGVSFVYEYYGKNGDLIGLYRITPRDCGYPKLTLR